MAMKNIRVWQNLNIDEVKKHLIITEDIIGMCGNCQQLNLNYKKDKKCPSCHTEFRYITVRNDSFSDIKRISESINSKTIPLILIDHHDYKDATAKNQIDDLFKK